MTSTFQTPEEYILSLSDDRREVVQKLSQILKANLPEGFREEMSYDMLGYVVPHELYPAGYHCNPKLPLPMINLASQKNFIALYHMGIYANPELLDWFTTEYKNRCKSKLDMGKSCIRFKKMEDIPFELIGELAKKLTPQNWIELYEASFVKK